MWEIYKNGRGCRRKDRIYIHRAWNWFPPNRGECCKMPGWDVCLGSSLWVTYPEQPLTDVQAKVDARFPYPDPNKYRGVGSSICYFICDHCKMESLIEVGQHDYRGTTTCVSCGAQTKNMWRPENVRQIELLPDQRVSAFAPESLRT